jgi:hypothetical protein
MSRGRPWRDPDEDLPRDFEDNQDGHYAALAKPVDARAFIADLKKRMTAGLDRLNEALAAGTAGGVRVITRKGAAVGERAEAGETARAEEPGRAQGRVGDLVAAHVVGHVAVFVVKDWHRHFVLS